MKKPDLPINKSTIVYFLLFFTIPLLLAAGCQKESTSSKQQTTIPHNKYVIVGTGQDKCYNNAASIPYPGKADAFYGQDAQHQGLKPSYKDNGNGTITDRNTGLMWEQDPGDKMNYSEAVSGADTFELAGYDDWRLPTIKELYSLILFSGIDPIAEAKDTSGLTPFIDTDYFKFTYGDPDAGDRIIDSQYASSTKYVSTTMNGNKTVFGVNFADGRIKGYPSDPMPGQQEGKKFFILHVRGNTSYGKNNFKDNGDQTITDRATGLTWSKTDSGKGMDWQAALEWVQQKNNNNYLGYNDWRLPNAKELQSIVDYSRSPKTSNSAAIDPVFKTSSTINEDGEDDYPFFWTSTTHVSSLQKGKNAVCIVFGQALGWMEVPSNSGQRELLDVHGAGAQRSDPKTGNTEDFPHGRGPQGDVIRIDNYVRLVRGSSLAE